MTVLFGPRLNLELHSQDGESTTNQVDVDSTLSFLQVGDGTKKSEYQYDHIVGFKFGYSNLPDWKAITLMESSLEVGDSIDITASPQHSPAGKIKPKLFTVGEIIEDATVVRHHKDGTIFQLDATQTGMYFLNKMAQTEAATREILLRVGAPIAVCIMKVKKRNKRTLIEVKTVD